jgi:predicted lipoprotein
MTKGLFTMVCAGLFLMQACTDKDENKNDQATRFDRKEMLVNYADNIIIPAFNDAATAMRQLQISILAFCNTPSEATLKDARNAYKNAGLMWQYVNGYNFGPAVESGLRKTLNEEIGTFPTSAGKIESYINNNDTSFNNFDRDSRGLFAIDYLLYDNSGQNVLVKFEDQNRKNYLLRCINHATAQLIYVVNQWPSYRNEFVNNTGTDIGSSTSIFYNEFLKNFEGLKNFKFGVPLGVRPGQNTPLPTNVEAYYSGLGAQFANENWKACKQIWEGQSKSGTNGTGLRGYVASVVGGDALVTNTRIQAAAVDAVFAQLPDSPTLSQLIQTQFNTVDAVHTELQKLTRFYKSDLSSLIGIAVTFSSGDGD